MGEKKHQQTMGNITKKINTEKQHCKPGGEGGGRQTTTTNNRKKNQRKSTHKNINENKE